MSSETCYSRRQLLAAGVGLAAWRPLRAATAAPVDIVGLTLTQASAKVRAKSLSPVALTLACLDRIDKYNPALNAFITVTRDQALETAHAMEAEQKRGKFRGPLHGIPIGLKDNMDTEGVRTTGASELFKDRIPTEDAEVVRRLKKAGAVILGKLNMHELAYGGGSSVSYFGAVHNPWALDHEPGGSSGGSAAAVAGGLCFAALGTDTAGSVRIPASYCGIAGLKPTYGRVSIRGIIPLSPSLDHCGPLCKTVEDVALMLSVIAGYDDEDPTSFDTPVQDYVRWMGLPVAKLRLGVPRNPYFDGLDPEVDSAVADAIEVLRKLAGGVTDVTIPKNVNPALIWDPEIYAYHAKWIKETPELYQPATRAAILKSGQISAETYAGAHWEMEQQRRDIRKAFTGIDLLITPTMPGVAPLIVPNAPVPNAPVLEPPNPDAPPLPRIRGGGSNTSPFDVFGLPTITVPCGFSKSGLPIGLQISGAPFAEGTVLALARAYQQATDWHKRHPELGAT